MHNIEINKSFRLFVLFGNGYTASILIIQIHWQMTPNPTNHRLSATLIQHVCQLCCVSMEIKKQINIKNKILV